MEVHKEDPEEVFEMLEKLGEGYDQFKSKLIFLLFSCIYAHHFAILRHFTR